MLALDEKIGKWRKQRKSKDRPFTGGPAVFSDIKKFISNAGNTGGPS